MTERKTTTNVFDLARALGHPPVARQQPRPRLTVVYGNGNQQQQRPQYTEQQIIQQQQQQIQM